MKGIVLIHFGSIDDTRRCIASIAQHQQAPCHVILIDNTNGQAKNIVNEIDVQRHVLSYIKQDNIGFAAAVNLACKKLISIGAEHALVLNNDAYLIDNSAAIGFDYIKKHPNAGVVGLVNYFDDRPDIVWQAGGTQKAWFPGFRQVRVIQGQEIIACDYVPGSSFIVELKSFFSVGGLEEKYFAYYEEIDFCRKIRSIGMEVGVIPNTKVMHKVGASSSSAIKAYLKSRNKLYYYSSEEGPTIRKIFFLLMISLLYPIQCFFVGGVKNFGAALRGMIDFFGGRMGRPPYNL